VKNNNIFQENPLPKGFIKYKPLSELTSTHDEIKPLVKHKGDLMFHDTMISLFKHIEIKDGMTLSFHHHLRDGDFVMNMILEHIHKLGIKNLTLAASAIFPVHNELVKYIESGMITSIVTNYLNGEVAKKVSQGRLKGLLIMDSHGGRPRAIETGELVIDLAFIATPAVDQNGNGSGVDGKNACGTLGYPQVDLRYAKQKVLVTDTILKTLTKIDIEACYVDHILKVESIGDRLKIVSGTTKPTKDPVQLKIAHLTEQLLFELGLIKTGFSFQTGAGGTSLAVAKALEERMITHHVKGSFASGGITDFLVKMHVKGLFERLYDVQCFDLSAVESYKINHNHFLMSASQYANPLNPDRIAKKLDVVILGATEIDLNFNVNVTSDSSGYIMGGSGGHSDTAFGAKVSIITTQTIKGRMPSIKDQVTYTTTPGETVDILVTERGISINPRRQDLMNKLQKSKLPIYKIEELYQKVLSLTGIPKKPSIDKTKIVGYIRYPNGTIIDTIYKVGDSTHVF
jgi:citrate lyase subunit alpha / citrate CoA-transferase